MVTILKHRLNKYLQQLTDHLFTEDIKSQITDKHSLEKFVPRVERQCTLCPKKYTT